MSYVLARLDAEWRRIARGPAARRALRRWAATYPVLGGLSDLDGLLERRRDPAVGPAILRALAAFAASEELAARALLQALLPGLLRLAGRIAVDDPVAVEDMTALAWERIRTYPVHRSGTVAGNVLLDVLRRYRRHREINDPSLGVEWRDRRRPNVPRRRVIRKMSLDGDDGLREVNGGVVPSPEDEAVGRVVCRDWAAEQRMLLGERRFGLVIDTRVEGVSLAEIAAREGVAAHTLTVRRLRAEQRMQRSALAA